MESRSESRLALTTSMGLGRILAKPYAILSGSLPPQRTGSFVTLPEILAALGFGRINSLLGNSRLVAVIGGGLLLILAAILVARVRETADSERMAAAYR